MILFSFTVMSRRGPFAHFLFSWLPCLHCHSSLGKGLTISPACFFCPVALLVAHIRIQTHFLEISQESYVYKIFIKALLLIHNYAPAQIKDFSFFRMHVELMQITQPSASTILLLYTVCSNVCISRNLGTISIAPWVSTNKHGLHLKVSSNKYLLN